MTCLMAARCYGTVQEHEVSSEQLLAGSRCAEERRVNKFWSGVFKSRIRWAVTEWCVL